MKIYISGPITGTEDYKQRFRAAELELKERKHIPINPAKVNATLPAKHTSHEEYMRISFLPAGHVRRDLYDAKLAAVGRGLYGVWLRKGEGEEGLYGNAIGMGHIGKRGNI